VLIRKHFFKYNVNIHQQRLEAGPSSLEASSLSLPASSEFPRRYCYQTAIKTSNFRIDSSIFRRNKGIMVDTNVSLNL